jgi:catechol 2,3-dioxygenase-like lactoylglutathione lyase family enzyme
MASVQIRYIVNDVDASIKFYCRYLGFRQVMTPSPAFAMLERGDLRLVLSKPNLDTWVGQAMADGTKKQEPGGWNRFSIEVKDIEITVAALRQGGVSFRNGILKGVGGKQIIIDDPSGNPVELFEPTVPEARLESGG